VPPLLLANWLIRSLVAFEAPGTQTAPVLDSIPAIWLHGDTLSVRPQNFAVIGPARWRWARQSVAPNRNGIGEAFVVASPSGDSKFLVVPLSIQLWHLDDSVSQAFVRGLLQSRLAGWEVSDVATARATIPSSGAMKYQFRWTSSDGQVLYQFGYLVPGRTSYLLSTTTANRSEPSAFREMVASFKTLNSSLASARVPAVLVIGNPRIVFLVLLALLAAIETIVRLSSGATTSIGLTLPSRLLMFVGVLASVFLPQTDLSPDEAWAPVSLAAASALGAMTATLAMAAGVSYVAYGRASNRNWNKFARLFCLLSLVFPILAAIGNAGR